MNPEAGAKLAAPPIEELSRWEALPQRARSDEGYIALGGILTAIASSRPLQKLITGVAGLGVVAGLGIVHNVSSRISGEHEVTVSAKPAEYEGSFVYEMPVTCWGGYDSKVSPVAVYDYKVNVDLPFIGTKTLDTHYKFGVALDSENTNILCTKAAKVAGEQPVKGGGVDVALTPDDFSSYIFPTNPLTDQITTTNGLLAGGAKILEDALKTANDLPVVGSVTQHVNVSSTDQLNSALLGYDRMMGNMQSTKICSRLAWNDLDTPNGPLEQSIAAAVAEIRGVTPDKVHVHLPSTLALTDQYDPKYQNLQQSASVAGGVLSLTLPQLTDKDCIPSPNHNQVVTVPANAELASEAA